MQNGKGSKPRPFSVSQEQFARNWDNIFKKRFKKGDVTDEVWCGDIVTQCEFLAYLPDGNMLFFDKKFKCNRIVKEVVGRDGVVYLDGWTAV